MAKDPKKLKKTSQKPPQLPKIQNGVGIKIELSMRNLLGFIAGIAFLVLVVLVIRAQ